MPLELEPRLKKLTLFNIYTDGLENWDDQIIADHLCCCCCCFCIDGQHRIDAAAASVALNIYIGAVCIAVNGEERGRRRVGCRPTRWTYDVTLRTDENRITDASTAPSVRGEAGLPRAPLSSLRLFLNFLQHCT